MLIPSLLPSPLAAQVLTASAAVTLKKLTTTKSLQMLFQLHCTSGHRNFSDVAKRFGLTLPITFPECWSGFHPTSEDILPLD